MSQESFIYSRRDQRRRRRFTVASRTYLGFAVAAQEGAFATFLLLTISWTTSTGSGWHAQDLIAATILGAIYAWFAAGPAQRFLAFPGQRRVQAGQILFSWTLIGITDHLASPLMWQSSSMSQIWLWWGLGAAVLLSARLLVYCGIGMMFAAGRFQIERVGLVGDADVISRFQDQANIWRQGCQVVATHTLSAKAAAGAQELSEFAKLCIARHCDHVLVVGELGEVERANSVVDACQQYALNVVYAPFSTSGNAPYKLLDVLPLGPANSIRMLGRPLDDRDQVVKRAFDIIVSCVALVVLLPVLAVVALLIWATSPGPVLYRQERRGFNGQPFYIYKFRSMTVTEDGRAMLPAVHRDPRITPLGHFLRRTSIDELPQLLNVLVGDMSLVGPRPHALSHDDELSLRYATYARRRRIKPGITGWAQVNGFRGDVSTQEKIEGRTQYDLHYIEHWSVELDIWILVLTLLSRQAHKDAG